MLKCPKASHPLSTNIACLYAQERIDSAKIGKRFETPMSFREIFVVHMQNSVSELCVLLHDSTTKVGRYYLESLECRV